MKTIENGSKSVIISVNTYAGETTYTAVCNIFDQTVRCSKPLKTERGAEKFARKWLGL